jgi:protein phosphatase
MVRPARSRSGGRFAGGNSPCDLRREPILAGDTFVLCSDGLCGMVDDGAILEAVARHQDLDAAATALVAAANEAGGADNITVVLVRSEK